MRKQKYRIGIIFLILLLTLSLNAFALEGNDVDLDSNRVDTDISELEGADSSDAVLPAVESVEESVKVDKDDDIALEKNDLVAQQSTESIDIGSFVMEVGDKADFGRYELFDSTYIKDAQSSDNNIVEITDLNRYVLYITAMGKGTANISVTAENGDQCHFTVTVNHTRYLSCPESIVVKPISYTKYKSDSSRDVSYVKSSDDSVVKVETSYGKWPTFYALKEGTATLTFGFYDSKRTETVDVTVKLPDLVMPESSTIDLIAGDSESVCRIDFKEDLTGYYTEAYGDVDGINLNNPIVESAYASNDCVSISRNAFAVFVYGIKPGTATVTVVPVRGETRVFNVTVKAKEPEPIIIKDRGISSISTIYRNTKKVTINVINVKAGDVLKLQIGKKIYKKKLTTDSDNCNITIKIKKPKKYGQYVYAWLETDKGTFYYDDQEDEAYVYYGKKIKKGLTKKQVKWTSTWGSPSDTASASGGRSYWYYDDGSVILFKKGKVKKWYDAGGFD